MFEHSDLALSMLVLFRADHFAGLTSGAAAISAEHCRSSYEIQKRRLSTNLPGTNA